MRDTRPHLALRPRHGARVSRHNSRDIPDIYRSDARPLKGHSSDFQLGLAKSSRRSLVGDFYSRCLVVETRLDVPETGWVVANPATSRPTAGAGVPLLLRSHEMLAQLRTGPSAANLRFLSFVAARSFRNLKFKSRTRFIELLVVLRFRSSYAICREH